MTTPEPTIVALATPPGRAALALVRLSGDGVAAVRDAICRPRVAGRWTARRARWVDLVADGAAFDDAVAVYSPGPATATGEDTLELTLHGNPLLVERLIAACVRAGAQLARPGAFTRRAVLHGRQSLLAAEGVDQLIRATSEAGLQVARGSARLERVVSALAEELRVAAAELEARLDYPDDELALLDDAALIARMRDTAARARALAGTYRTGRISVEGARVALVGEVNAGKSSLFNRLVGSARALVHDRPGTTRDVIESRVQLGGLELTLLDTAGERITDDPVEAAGLALAAELVADADLLLVVCRADGVGPTPGERAILNRIADRPRLIVLNQVDRAPDASLPGAIRTSARTGEGIDALRDALAAALTDGPRGDEAVVGSLRQAQLLGQLADGVEAAVDALHLAGVAAASEELVEALGAVDALTGADTREAVLDALFARFCIGK